MTSKSDEPEPSPWSGEPTIAPGTYRPYEPPVPPPATYGAPPPPSYGPPRGTNALAIASLVCSIVWACGAASLAAVITGHLARGQVRRTGEQGGGMALAGLIIGYLGLAVVVGYLVFLVVVLVTDPGWLDD
jgi:hypothetical protein